MTSRQRPWPRAWLMTDERMGDQLWTAIDRLPIKHSGIVFRHYGAANRASIARRIAEICHRRSLTFAIAGDVELARTLRANLVHNPDEPAPDLAFSRSIHSLEEAEAIALGGVNSLKAARLQSEGFYGWAGIDAWLGDDSALRI